MKEITFLKQNNNKWKEFEQILLTPEKANPRRMADLFIEITDDLSYSRTYYPDSKTTDYLNGLASRIHQEIYKNKRENRTRFFRFWAHELPLHFKKYHFHLGVSLIVFLLACTIGAFSTYHDESIPRIILGDYYVDQTIERIKAGNPLGIYGEDSAWTMFIQITINNIRVSFITFVFGIFFSVGTGVLLFQNGMMLGSFLMFFKKYAVSAVAMKVVWIHGAFEISAIVIAGAAGFALGNSILFPGTLPRGKSMLGGALDGMKIIIGLIPVFIAAGFLESFVTRHVNMAYWKANTIIFGSFGIIIYYFVIYPYLISLPLSKRILYSVGSIVLLFSVFVFIIQFFY